MSKAFLLRRATASTAAGATLQTGECQFAVAVIAPATDEDSANVVTQSFANVLTGPVDFATVFITNTSGTHRTAGNVTISGQTVTVTESNLATTDRVVIHAFSSPLF